MERSSSDELDDVDIVRAARLAGAAMAMPGDARAACRGPLGAADERAGILIGESAKHQAAATTGPRLWPR